MRSQLWILAQAQVLDLLFSEHHTDGSLTPSPKRFEHSLDRISPRPMPPLPSKTSPFD